MTVGNYIYFLSVAKNGCKSIDTAKVEVKSIPLPIGNNSKIIVGQMANLAAHDTTNDGLYIWKIPYINTKNDNLAEICVLTMGKYEHELKVKKNGCSSMNISKIEAQKDDTIMYYPNSWTR